ncbi:MAG: ABC transporter permease [Candidatus Aminicenantes bacterium]|nr:ABC transporter permease [Candidatus Aminicenantes bacterium]
MNTLIQKLFAFLKRDFLEEASYKFSFVTSFVGIFLSSATFFFISKLISPNSDSVLDPYGGDYFSFVIIGIAFSGLLAMFQERLPAVIRQAQITGTLEAILVSRTSIPVILFGSSLYYFLFSVVSTVFHLVLAVIVFGMQVEQINWLGALATFFLTAVCFLSIGILSACFILVYKKGNPFSWIYGSVSGLLGGVFFPIKVLPGWIKWISYLLPITYSLEGLRKSIITSSSFSEILPSILALSVFAGIFFPLSLYTFRLALKKAKKDGTLTHY